MEALRCLKRRLSDVIYRRLVNDAQNAQSAPGAHEDAGPGGHCGATQESSAADLTPHIDTLDKPLPEPENPTLRRHAAPGKTTPQRVLEHTA